MSTNIVLLADGTGNSSSSPFKTNVWRLYQAINISTPPDGKARQIVYYDNGVGTENFAPLAALGGAFGVGVWRNVKDLYTFVCRNYVKDDQIYGFGFSRGAFTIRLLMGLIGKCGIVKANSDAQLNHCVQMAYEAYRRDFLLRASRRHGMIYHRILREPKYIVENENKTTAIDLSSLGCDQEFPDIRFVGVWDTVDAYGMPIDELKIAIDEWVWPTSFADRDPSKRLLTIRHALALDDERPTFRPVLWNEKIADPNHPNDESKRTTLDQAKIQQVWFAGVHANVGGGYPDDGLAYVSLNWMMDEAEAQGLHYIGWIRTEIHNRASPQGEQYDSRSGVAGYYRYGPRKIAELCDDKEHGVSVPTVRVHSAAFDRIVARERSYAPVSLGGDFKVAGSGPFAADAAALEEAWDMVWWRRLAYFTTLGLTAFLVLFALKLMWAWPGCILAPVNDAIRAIVLLGTNAIAAVLPGFVGSTWTSLIDQVGASLPGSVGSAWSAVAGLAGASWAGRMSASVAEYPYAFIVAAGLLAWTFLSWSQSMQNRIQVHAEWAWAKHKRLIPAAEPKPDWHNSVAGFLRPITARLYRWWLAVLVPVLGVGIGFVAMVLFSPYWIKRLIRRRPPWMA